MVRSHRHDIEFVLAMYHEYKAGSFKQATSNKLLEQRLKIYFYAIQFGWDEAIKRAKAVELKELGLDAHVIAATIKTMDTGGMKIYPLAAIPTTDGDPGQLPHHVPTVQRTPGEVERVLNSAINPMTSIKSIITLKTSL